ncbi:probable LRR receptor-like serine/threonine-protein kinase RKF3 [Mangifera indica]|uniref:probable LRR receptor-like serine/threonine-protein kinase RKF3 n=1 Tax=Mangifera indica TaxID=29780 RepID=UPI001CFA8BC1|nr:probable LRR receptor-like serine/threonine-protein kinase RKF3 [Mangifera indica]
MSNFQFLFIFFIILLTDLPTDVTPQQQTTDGTVSCPLDFNVLRPLITGSVPSNMDLSSQCQYIRQGLRLVQSNYLRLSGNFMPPLNSSDSCWQAYQNLTKDFLPNFDIRSRCGYETSWISQGCMNITTKTQFEELIPKTVLNDVVSSCNQSLKNSAPCASCTTSLSSLPALYLTGKSTGNLSDCGAYPSIYAAAVANQFGPTNEGTSGCLFGLGPSGSKKGGKNKHVVIIVVLVVCGIGLLLIITGVWFLWHKRVILKRKMKHKDASNNVEMGLQSISESTHLVRFTFEEIKKATRNFSRDNIIGKGGYGNVYKGVLPDGSEVAFKRFKNCSASGDANFTHEVEVIASVRHVNLVALRGYCIASTPLEGHQRIIVCDLMRNGSLYDHLFGSVESKLSWPIRQKIALGTARGLAYLHYGAQPAIFHRDIKASNILLDEKFEPKVADFGLAKFTPEGMMTHLSTRVAGTMGYVAPEYALYGQLTERSDVYSFGVVLLELLSGRKALVLNEDNQPSLVTDWAWSLVRTGNALDVVDNGMPELGTPEILEKYVLIAILCSHPQLYARPTMDQVVKMLETELSIPSIPERPISIVADMDEIERSVSSSGSAMLFSFADFKPFVETDRSAGDKEEGENYDSRNVELL